MPADLMPPGPPKPRWFVAYLISLGITVCGFWGHEEPLKWMGLIGMIAACVRMEQWRQAYDRWCEKDSDESASS